LHTSTETVRRAALPAAAEPYRTARDIIRILRSELLALDEGTFVGSVASLMGRFGISRSTLRQAIRVLEHEQLLVAKRGPSGGFYASRPRIDSVVAAAAGYLHARNVEVADFLAIARILNNEMARLASQCSDPVLRQQLAAMLDRTWRGNLSPNEVVKADLELEQLLTRMAGSPMIELFMRVTYSLGLRTLNEGWMTAPRARPWQRQRLAVGEAVLSGDLARATAVSDRHYDIISKWLTEARNGRGIVRVTEDARRAADI
jgi:GntR family transcriptional regulator, transcriptional repressor for pyruvate dehydrogenase complex